MKSTAKRAGAVAIFAAYAVTAFAGLGISVGTHAAADGNEGLTYFYGGLKHNPRAEKVYKAFETLESNGSLKKNKVDFNLVESGTIVEEDVKNYVEHGDSKFPVAFGAGRDAFYMDNPDLFYVNVFGVSVSAGTESGGKYVAFLDTSRVDSLYLSDLTFEGTHKTEADVNGEIEKYEAKLTEAVNAAKAAGEDKKTQVEFVNDYIAERTEYSFCNNPDGSSAAGAEYVSTAYGALVNGKAVCGGYAKAFKAVMDRLDIPCVCVQGYGNRANESGNLIEHMWNAVKLEGQWYGVDVTWNDTAGKNKWLLIGEETISKDHYEDKVVSSSGYELKYPALKPYDYGIDTDANGMNIKGNYIDSSEDGGKLCEIVLSYGGKGAKKLEDEGKYLAYRYGETQDDDSVQWTDWISFTQSADYMFPSSFTYDGTKSKTALHATIEMIQFAFIDYAPDDAKGATYPSSAGELAGKPCYYCYDASKLTSEHISSPSVPFRNEWYGSYIPAPWPYGTPSNGGAYNVNATYDIKLVYTESLTLAEGKTVDDVGLDITLSRGGHNFNDFKQHITVSDVKWDGDKTVTFKFTPSKMYAHNLAHYHFIPTNLVGVKSHKTPEPATYTFQAKSVVCSKVFNDGRLYMCVYGQPKILDTSDLSLNEFKDDAGNYFAQNQRSQLMLVADTPGKGRTDEMLNRLETDEGIGKKDVVTASTYEIDLQICGIVKKVPNGSFMQVAFGFPEGYDPNDSDTTYKVYHYKHDDAGNITGVEEIPLIVTPYGLIAKVQSFSPFTVVQVKKSAVAANETKSVYASVLGNGGSIDKTGINNVDGEEITYSITKENGYQLDKVMLNGKALENVDKNATSVTLKKSDLEAGNTLEVTFVKSAAADNYAARGIEIKTPDTIVLDAADIAGYFADPDTNATAIAVTVGVLAVVLAGSALAIYIAVVKTRPAKRRK